MNISILIYNLFHNRFSIQMLKLEIAASKKKTKHDCERGEKQHNQSGRERYSERNTLLLAGRQQPHRDRRQRPLPRILPAANLHKCRLRNLYNHWRRRTYSEQHRISHHRLPRNNRHPNRESAKPEQQHRNRQPVLDRPQSCGTERNQPTRRHGGWSLFGSKQGVSQFWHYYCR